MFAPLFFTFAGSNYLLPFYLEHVHNYSTAFSGLILTVMSVGMMITGVLVGLIYTKLTGKIRYMIMAGAVLIMNAGSPTEQGMLSSLTGLGRFAPIIIDVAVYNILLLSGILTAVKDTGITERPPSFIAEGILSAGFDLAVLATLLLILCIGISEGKFSEK